MTIKKNLSHWLDYDEGQLLGLTLEEKLRYFEGRVQLVLIRPLDRLIEKENFQGTADSTALLIAVAAICHGIEALGRFYQNGRKNTDGGDCFRAFASDYMHEDMRLKKVGNKHYPDLLWDNFRCGISHGFRILAGGLEGSKSDGGPYFVVNGNRLTVHPYKFYADFRNAFEQYLKDLRKPKPSPGLIENFENAFEWFFIKRR